MVQHRVVQLRQGMLSLLQKMGADFFQGRLACVFLVNNTHFITREVNRLPEKHQILADDLNEFETSKHLAIEEYITMTLTDLFPGLMQAVGTKEDSDSDSSLDGSSRKREPVAPKVLEAAAQDFSYYYKQKAEQIAKEVRQTLAEDLVSMVSQKIMRTVCLKYSVLAEQCKAACPGVLKSLPSSNQVMLDLSSSGLKV